jgi:hypothetical protein
MKIRSVCILLMICAPAQGRSQIVRAIMNQFRGSTQQSQENFAAHLRIETNIQENIRINRLRTGSLTILLTSFLAFFARLH